MLPPVCTGSEGPRPKLISRECCLVSLEVKTSDLRAADLGLTLFWYGDFFRPSHTFTFNLSPRLCPSTARCSPPSVSSIVLCLLPSWSRWFPPSLLCRLAIFCLVVLLISSLSLVASPCSVWPTYMSGPSPLLFQCVFYNVNYLCSFPDF